MKTEPILSVRDLKVHFPLPGGLFRKSSLSVKALDGVDFDLWPGETLGIVGESGCGKSTLGRAILRLVQPKQGQVFWQGRDLLQMDPLSLRQERRHMQIIFQDPLASLDPRMKIAEIVMKPLQIFHPALSRKEMRKRVIEMLEQVGMNENALERYPHEFSGGQCQRIGIARAMILKPRLIICDEPVSALDVSIQAQVINLLMRLQKEFNLTLLFISHNLSVVRHISHRILVLYLGKVAELASRDDFYRKPLHPYSQALISAVPIPDPMLEKARSRISMEGDIPSPIHPPSGCRFRTRCPLAREICATSEPQLRLLEDQHFCACHFAG